MCIDFYKIIILLLLVSAKLNSQTTTELKGTQIGFKVGTTMNVVNKAFYKDLNKGLKEDIYKPTSTVLFINPYLNIGTESHFRKHVAISLNTGVYQTAQKYESSYSYRPTPGKFNPIPDPGYDKLTEVNRVHNCIYVELLPAYVYKNTRILAGCNVTRVTPIIHSKVTTEYILTGEKIVADFHERAEESFHAYSILGIMQGFPIKNYEMTVTMAYFGLLKKYDSGVNLAIGFLF